MSNSCQKITVRTISHTHTTSDITDFVDGVSAIAIDILDDYNTGVAASGEPLFVSWANSYSAELINTSNVVELNSAIVWNYQGNDIKSLTANWENTKTTVQNYSSLWILSGGSTIETDPIFTAWAHTYSGNYEIGFNNLISNSAAYLSSPNLTVLSQNSGDWNNISIVVKSNSALWILSGIDSEVDPVFSNWLTTSGSSINGLFSVVYSNSGTIWNYQGGDVKSLTAEWNDTSNIVQTYSALWILSGGSSVAETDPIFTAWAQTYSASYQTAYNNLISNSAAYLTSNDLTLLASNSANWNNAYTTVNNNSSVNWNYQGLDIKSLTSTWNNTYNTVNNNSAIWGIDTDNTAVNNFVNTNSSDIVLVNSTVKNNSALWILSGGASVPETDPIFSAWLTTSAGNIQALYTTVGLNSSIVWNYQGTDIKVLTGNWQNVYSTVGLNSGAWGVDTDNSQVNTFVNTNSSDIILINSVVKTNSALWILSGLSAETDPIFTTWAQSYSGQFVSVYSSVNSNSGTNWNYQGSDIKSLTGRWDNSTTIVQNNSAQWSIDTDNSEVNTFVNNNSANIILVDNTVKNNSALWILSGLSTETDPIFTTWAQAYSGNYQIAYTNLISNSASYLTSNDLTLLNAASGNWNSAYTTVNISSSITWNYQGTDIKILTGGWENISNVVKNYSALWILSGGASVPETDPIFTAWAQSYSANYQTAYNNLISNSAAYLTSNDLTLVQSSSGNWNNVYTTVNTNSTTWTNNYTHEIWVGAGAMLSPTLSGAQSSTTPLTASSNNIFIDTFAFDAGSIEYVQFNILFPNNANKQSIKLKFSWFSTTTGDVVWGGQCKLLNDSTVIDSPWGNSQEVIDSSSGSGNYQLSNATSTLSPSGAVSGSGVMLFRLFRNASSGSDTLAADALLQGVSIQYSLSSHTLSAW